MVRRVNSRAFSSSLGPTLPGAAFVSRFEVAQATVEGEPPVGDGWRVKYAFGMAGRNQRVISSASRDPRDLAFIKKGLGLGGVQIEAKRRHRRRVRALHGLIGEDGSLRVGALVQQRCDARGAWIVTERIATSREALGDVPDRMADEARRVGQALFVAGYFGPFGIDGYTYWTRMGERCLQARSEINARYSMGFALGFDQDRTAAVSPLPRPPPARVH